MKDILIKLLTAYGASGREDNVRSVIAELAKPYADEITEDALGNLFVHKRGSGKRIMVSAHMDQIGFIVTDIDDEGFLRVHNVGGIRRMHSLNRHVVFPNGVSGVLSYEDEDFKQEGNSMLPLFIDIGAKDKADAMKLVEIGDIAVYSPDVFELANEMMAGPAMDDRIGCAVALEALKTLGECDSDVTFVFSTQEELGCRGAGVAAFALEPELGIALDVTIAGDMPKGPKISVGVNKGPCIKVMDHLAISSPKVVRMFEARAKEANIACQREVLRMGGTDAAAIQLSKSGVYVGVISIACRYVHSSCEAISLKDSKECADLLVAILKNPEL